MVALVASLGLTSAGSFKRNSSFGNHLDQAIDAVAAGAVASLVMLLVLNRSGASDPLDAIVGKIVVQALPLSLGASVANPICIDRLGEGLVNLGNRRAHARTRRAGAGRLGIACTPGAIAIGRMHHYRALAGRTSRIAVSVFCSPISSMRYSPGLVAVNPISVVVSGGMRCGARSVSICSV